MSVPRGRSCHTSEEPCRSGASPVSMRGRALLRAAGFAVFALGLMPVSLYSVPVSQQSTTDQVTVLSMQEALRRASEHSPQYREALNQMELAGPQRRAAWGAFLPNLSVNYSTGQSFSRQATAVDFFGEPVTREAATRISSNASQGATIGLTLFEGGSRFHNVADARAQADIRVLAGQNQLNAILADVQRQFLAAQRLKANLSVQTELLAERQQDADVARRRFELASIGRSDLLGRELELETQRAAVSNTRGQFAKALLALRRAIGDPDLKEMDVTDAEPEPFDPATLDIEGIVALALREGPPRGRSRGEPATTTGCFSLEQSEALADDLR